MSTSPIIPPQPPPERPFGPAWRIVLAVALLISAGLLLAFWPALSAIGGALASWSGVIAVLLLVFGGGALVAALWSLIALAFRLTAQARQAHIFTLPNGMPAYIGDVPAARHKRSADGLVAQLLKQSMVDHAAQMLATAQRPTPLLTSQNQHIHIESVPPPIAESAAPAQLPQLTSGGGTLAQLRQIGHVCRSGNSLLAGYNGGKPLYVEMPECGFIGIGGRPRVGKSVTACFLIEQAVLSGWHVFVGDPHIHKEDGLLNRLRPLSGRLAKQAVTPDEIAAMIRLVDKIGRRRAQGDADRTPCLMVVDELSNLVWRDLLPTDVLAILPSMAAEHAGVSVHGALIAHDWSKASLGGDLGAALRRAITHRFIHAMDPGNVEFLLPKGGAAQARAVQLLDKGQALYFGPDGAATVAVPLVGDEDAAYCAQGTPPRPYAPRPQLTQAAAPLPPIPPTTRVPQPPPRQPAPPTVPMNITVPEQIDDLLTARSGYMTASEIAAALRIDERVIRTEIKILVDAGQLLRRPCQGRTTRERYEYAKSTSQRINQSTALSA